MGVTLALAAAQLGILGSLDAFAGGHVEAAAGTAPIQVTAPSEPAVALIMEPFAGLQLTRPTWSALARYRPRAFWRQPNVAELDRPLYLHRGDIAHQTALTPRLTLEEAVVASYGELDYTGVNLAFAPSQPTLLDVAILEYYSVQGTVALTADLDRRRQLKVGVFGGQTGSRGVTPLPTHQEVGVAPALRMELTRRDTLTIPIALERHWIEGAFPITPTTPSMQDDDALTAFWVASAEAEYERALSQRTDAGLSAGARYVLDDDDESNVYPMALAFARTIFYQKRARRLSGELSVGLVPTLDVIRARYRPGLVTSGELLKNFDRYWSARLRVGSYVPVGTDPLVPPQDETSFSAELPVIYQPEPNLSFEAGLRHRFRSPHPDNGFEHNQVQNWAFVGVTFSETTGRSLAAPP